MAEWVAPLPPNDVVAGDTGHPAMHNELVDAITEVREVVDDVETVAGTAPTWASVTGKPAVIAAGADASAARTAIGAGTSNLALGTTSTTAKAGDYAPTWAQVTGKPATFAPVVGSGAADAAAGNHTHTGLLSGSATAVADATDETDVVAQFNALLAALRTRGVISAA